MIGEVYSPEVRFRQAIMSLNMVYSVKEEMDVFYVTQRAEQRLRKEGCREVTPINKRIIKF